ncbi:MAG TPA: lipoyl synthase [Acidimicrobiales bacterium]|nr:lipoyl synthase [Acidimicrobiales bacterium]
MTAAAPGEPLGAASPAEPLGPAAPGELLAPGRTLRLRWLGTRVAYRDAHVLQRALWAAGEPADDWLLLLEHPHVYTAGIRARTEHMLVEPSSVGAELLWVDRGGDITYHGPGQVVGYPVLSVPSGHSATPRYIHEVEQLVIDTLASLGLEDAGRLEGYPGVWAGLHDPGPRKICAIGARHSRRRTMHGFALNVSTDLAMFDHIVPCGISDKAVTSLQAEGLKVGIAEVVDAIFAVAAQRWGNGRPVERQDAAWPGAGPVATEASTAPTLPDAPTPASPAQASAPAGASQPVRLLGRLAKAGVDPAASLPLSARKPAWLRANAHMGTEFRSLRKTVRGLGLVTVCEEAGCPNIFECWADGTATFMINGDRCTRACGFCQVNTAKPLALDPEEPERVAEAVARLGLAHAVVTCVARDDLEDGGASAFAATIEALRRRCPGTAVEVLISDCKGDPAALGRIFDKRPDVLNHNVETVPRLQRAVRPSASYARSLAVLARAREAGLTTKSGLMVGLGETEEEVVGVLADLQAIGVQIVTIGQYLRPSAGHLPVARWWSPEDFARIADTGRALGISHVVASPLTRSSYHARQAAEGAGAAAGAGTGVGARRVADASGGAA